MILNQAQAEAVYGAMCSLNTVGAAIRGRIELTSDLEVKVTVTGCVQVWNTAPNPGSGFESFSTQHEFAAAYGLGQGPDNAKPVEPAGPEDMALYKSIASGYLREHARRGCGSCSLQLCDYPDCLSRKVKL